VNSTSPVEPLSADDVVMSSMLRWGCRLTPASDDELTTRDRPHPSTSGLLGARNIEARHIGHTDRDFRLLPFSPCTPNDGAPQ
jgi:hypothetical protein